MSESMSKYRMLGLIPRDAPKHAPLPILTGAQARVARGVVGWTQADLAKRARVALEVVRDIEAERSVPDRTLMRVRQVFDEARVELAAGGSRQPRA